MKIQTKIIIILSMIGFGIFLVISSFINQVKADQYTRYEQEVIKNLEQTNDKLEEILDQIERINDKIK